MDQRRVSKVWPFEEGWPDKPEMIVEGSLADREWIRVCTALDRQRLLSPAWYGVILVAALVFEELHELDSVMTQYGRTEELAASHARAVAGYRSACRDLRVTPDPTTILRPAQTKGREYDGWTSTETDKS